MALIPTWFLFALGAPALSAFGNFLDKFLLVRSERTGGIGSVLLFSCFFGTLVLPVAYLLGDVTQVPATSALILALNGMIWVGTLAAYLFAIRHDDVVSVLPTLQTIPLFGFVLGYLLLGEKLSLSEGVGSIIIVLCACILSLEVEDGAVYRFKWKSFLFALLSAFLFSVSGVVFKFFALEHGFWETQFWEFIGISLSGFLIFAMLPTYRTGFISVIRDRRFDVLGLNLATEFTMVSADLLLGYAVLHAPIALVYSMNSFHPAFLLAFALAAAFVSPRLMNELGFLRTHIPLKLVVILTMIGGATLINFDVL